MAGINVPIGAATVEFGTSTPTVFDITKGGITFSTSTSEQQVTTDQYGETVVKSIIKGRSAQVVVPFAVHDLEKLADVTPNATLIVDGVDSEKKKLVVKGNAGYDLTSGADKMVIKPTDPNATPSDYITIPMAYAMSDVEHTYNQDNERVVNVTFKALPDVDNDDELYILGDETASV